MSSRQDELQLQKASVFDRVDNNETVVAPSGLQPFLQNRPLTETLLKNLPPTGNFCAV